MDLQPRFSWAPGSPQAAPTSSQPFSTSQKHSTTHVAFQAPSSRWLQRSLSARVNTGAISYPSKYEHVTAAPAASRSSTVAVAAATAAADSTAAWSLEPLKQQVVELQGLADAAAAAAAGATNTLSASAGSRAGTRPGSGRCSSSSGCSTATTSIITSASMGTTANVTAQVNAALAAWAVIRPTTPGSTAASSFDASSARAALLQLYVCKASQVLQLLVGGTSQPSCGRSHSSSGAAADSAAAALAADSVTQLEPSCLAACLTRLQRLLEALDVANVSQQLVSYQEGLEAKAKLAVAQEDNTLLRNTLAQLKARPAMDDVNGLGQGGSSGASLSLEREVAALQETVVDLKRQLAANTRQLDSARLSAQAAQEDAAGLRKQVQVLSQRAEEARVGRTRAEDECAAVSAEVSQWQARCQALETKLQTLRRHADSLETALSTSSDCHTAQCLKEEQQRSEALAAQLQQCQVDLAQSQSQIQQLQAQSEQHTLDSEALQKALRDAKHQAAALQAQLQAAYKSLDRQKEAAALWEQKLSELTGDKARALTERDSVSEQLQAVRWEVTRMSGDLHTARAHMDERDLRVKALQGEVHELRQLVAEANRKQEQLQQATTSAEAAAQSATSRATTAEDKLQQAKQQVQELDQRLDDSAGHRQAAEGQLQEAQRKLECALSQQQHLQGQVEKLQEQVDQAMQAVNDKEKLLTEAAKRAEQASSEQASSRAALDAEWAEVAAMKQALQQDSQTVRAMGALVQARTLRFDIQSLANPVDSWSAAANGASGQQTATSTTRPLSAVANDAGQARLANMVRELQAQLQVCQARLSQQGLLTTTAQDLAQTAQAAQAKAEQRLLELQLQLEVKDQERLVLEKQLRATETQVDQALRQAKEGQSELWDVRRLLESSSRAGLTTEARVVLEGQLVDARRAADDKARLAAALGDQVAALRAEVHQLQESLHGGRAGEAPDSQELLSTSSPQPLQPKGRPPPAAATEKQGAAEQQEPPRPAKAASGQAALSSEVHTVARLQGPDVVLAEQLHKAHADLALLTDKLQDAERTIRRQDLLITDLQAKTHHSQSQLAAHLAAQQAEPTPRLHAEPTTSTTTSSSQRSSSDGLGTSLSAVAESAGMTEHLLQPNMAHAGARPPAAPMRPMSAATGGSTTHPPSISKVLRPWSAAPKQQGISATSHALLQAPVHAATTLSVPPGPRAQHGSTLPPSAAAWSQHSSPTGIFRHSGASQPPKSTTDPVPAARTPADHSVNDSDPQNTPNTENASPTGKQQPQMAMAGSMTPPSASHDKPPLPNSGRASPAAVPQPTSGLFPANSSTSHSPAPFQPWTQAAGPWTHAQAAQGQPAVSRSHARPTSALVSQGAGRLTSTPVGASHGPPGLIRTVSAGSARQGSHMRPASAIPSTAHQQQQRKTVLLLSASEPSAQAGLPSLAQATADAQRFLASWNAK